MLADELTGLHAKDKRRVLGTLPAVGILFYSVSGGAYGTEIIVQAAGPFLALVCFAVTPFLWCVPEALMTAELGTSLPRDAGGVLWVTRAFGPLAGFLEGWLSNLATLSDTALYPALLVDYLAQTHLLHFLGDIGWGGELLVKTSFSLLLCAVNLVGIEVVGKSTILLTALSLLPFLVVIVCAPFQDAFTPNNWLLSRPASEVQWGTVMQILFWNFNYWDSLGNIAGELKTPTKSIPRVMIITLAIVWLHYMLSLMASIALASAPGGGGTGGEWDKWDDGYYSALVGGTIGPGVAWLVTGGAFVCCIGLFLSDMTSFMYALSGMGEQGLLPACFSRLSRWQTPYVPLVLGLAVVCGLNSFSFDVILGLTTGLQAIASLLEFAALVTLRVREPGLVRPYRIPGGLPGVVLLISFPTCFCVVTLAVSDLPTVLTAGGALLVGAGVHQLLQTAGCQLRKLERGKGGYSRIPSEEGESDQI